MSYWQRLKFARKMRGLTLRGAARALNISPATLVYYENGAHKVNYEMMEKICKLYDVPIAYIAGEKAAAEVFKEV